MNFLEVGLAAEMLSFLARFPRGASRWRSRTPRQRPESTSSGEANVHHEYPAHDYAEISPSKILFSILAFSLSSSGRVDAKNTRG